MENKTIIDKIIEARYASNAFQAAHIANGLRLYELTTDQERMERVARYRAWRSSQIYPKDDTASCYQKAIEGIDPPQMDMEEIIQNRAKPIKEIPSDGDALADFFLNLANTPDVEIE